ncbi:MAG: hypothetical protein J0I06_25150 [Planctomycetes bacterium]|nr:hypothetical protein [Planctomycetota bacterium]
MLSTPAPPTARTTRRPFAARVANAGRRTARFASRNRTVVFFLLFLVLADTGFGLFAPLWGRYSPDDYTSRIRACAERPRDVVYVGGSPVAEGIDPAALAGVPWRGRPLNDGYAVGLSGGTSTDFYYATKLACPVPPRVLVYGITASDLNDARGEPHGARTLLAPRDLVEVMRTRPDAAEWTARHYLEGKFGRVSNVYHYRHAFRMWAATRADALAPGSCPEALRDATNQREHADDLTSPTGYAPLRGYALRRWDRMKAAGVRPPFKYLDKFRTGSHLRYVYKLADWCADHGVELVLVDMPVTTDWESENAAAFAEYRVRLAEVERERGLKVIRGGRDGAGLTDEHFADLIHLTPPGCHTFNAWLRGKLEEAGRTP